jgi:hypothetical protein
MRMFSISAKCPVHFRVTIDNKEEALFTTSKVLELSFRTIATVEADILNFW